MNEINKITIEINNLSPSQHEGLQKYIATLDADSTMVTIDGHGLVGELLIEEDEIDVCKSGFDCEGCKHDPETCEYVDGFYRAAKMVSLIDSDYMIYVDCPHYESEYEEGEDDFSDYYIGGYDEDEE